MRRLFLSFCLAAVFTSALFASGIDISKARLAASGFLKSRTETAGFKISANLPNYTIGKEGVSTIFILPLDPVGFIMVSADDASYPVPCFSTESNYSEDNQPENFREWISGYSGQVFQSLSTSALPDPSVAKAWNELLRGTTRKSASTIAGPLIVSTWDQGYPYNYLCPEDQGGSGGHVWSGCVATAMSQIANYWRWPLQGTGSHGYNSDYGYLFADFGNSTYNWEEMTNAIDGENFQMAQIQYHMGISVNMMYGPNGSGAYSDDAANALINYFGMDPSLHLDDAPNPVNDSWKSMIRNEIDAGRPLYYHGFGSGGHAFNLDGYDGTDYFHFNWGWSGSFNGYYYLNNLNPGGSNFNNGQGAIFGIQPVGNYPYYCNSTDTLRMYKGTIEDGSGPTQPYLGNTNCSWLIIPDDSITGIKLTFHRFNLGNDGDALVIYDGQNTDAPVLATYTGNSIPPVTTSSGGTMLIKFISNSSDNSGGWFASYDALKAVYCTGITTYTEPVGTLTDGSGTFEYHPNSVCRYRIAPDNATAITLTFDQFDTYDENDYLKIYDNTNNTLIQTLYGNTNPGTLTFPTGKLLLMFHTNKDNNAQGWQFRYAATVITGTGELTGDYVSRISPNPAGSFLNVDVVARDGKYDLNLYSPDGSRIIHDQVKAQPGLSVRTLDTANLPSGVYFLEMSTASGKFRQKVIIQH